MTNMTVSQRTVADLKAKLAERDRRIAELEFLQKQHLSELAKSEIREAGYREALESLRANELPGEPGMWGIKCITDHNAIIDAALAGKGVSRG